MEEARRAQMPNRAEHSLLNTDPTVLTTHSPRESIKTLTCRFTNCIVEIYRSKRRNVVGTYVHGGVAGLRLW